MSYCRSSRRRRTQRGRSAPHPVAEAQRVGVAGNRHDAGHDGNLDTRLLAALHEIEVGVGVVEELRQRAVGARLHLAAEVFEIGVGADRLRVNFGVRGHFDLERSPRAVRG